MKFLDCIAKDIFYTKKDLCIQEEINTGCDIVKFATIAVSIAVIAGMVLDFRPLTVALTTGTLMLTHDIYAITDNVRSINNSEMKKIGVNLSNSYCANQLSKGTIFPFWRTMILQTLNEKGKH